MRKHIKTFKQTLNEDVKDGKIEVEYWLKNNIEWSKRYRFVYI